MLDKATNLPSWEFKIHEGVVSAVVVTPDGRIASGDSNGEVHLWSPVGGESGETLATFDAVVVDLASNGGGDLAVSLDDGQVVLVAVA